MLSAEDVETSCTFCDVFVEGVQVGLTAETTETGQLCVER